MLFCFFLPVLILAIKPDINRLSRSKLLTSLDVPHEKITSSSQLSRKLQEIVSFKDKTLTLGDTKGADLVIGRFAQTDDFKLSICFKKRGCTETVVLCASSTEVKTPPKKRRDHLCAPDAIYIFRRLNDTHIEFNPNGMESETSIVVPVNVNECIKLEIGHTGNQPQLKIDVYQGSTLKTTKNVGTCHFPKMKMLANGIYQSKVRVHNSFCGDQLQLPNTFVFAEPTWTVTEIHKVHQSGPITTFETLLIVCHIITVLLFLIFGALIYYTIQLQNQREKEKNDYWAIIKPQFERYFNKETKHVTLEAKLAEKMKKLKEYQERVIWWKKYGWMDPKMEDKTQELSNEPTIEQNNLEKTTTKEDLVSKEKTKNEEESSSEIEMAPLQIVDPKKIVKIFKWDFDRGVEDSMASEDQCGAHVHKLHMIASEELPIVDDGMKKWPPDYLEKMAIRAATIEERTQLHIQAVHLANNLLIRRGFKNVDGALEASEKAKAWLQSKKNSPFLLFIAESVESAPDGSGVEFSASRIQWRKLLQKLDIVETYRQSCWPGQTKERAEFFLLATFYKMEVLLSTYQKEEDRRSFPFPVPMFLDLYNEAPYYFTVEHVEKPSKEK
uniref:Uncharacterized protein n=1 Tax=Panagrolaimus sp. JU765 TaxID=591449 RepID=A0AC34QIV2_9BILA